MLGRRTRSVALYTMLVPSLALVPCLADGAFAGTPEDEAQRLDDLLYFVTELDQGWDPLLAEMAQTVAAVPAPGTAVRTVRDRAAWSRAETLFAAGDASHEERCLELYDLLAADAVDADRKRDASRRGADIYIRRGDSMEKAGNEEGALDAFMKAVDRAPEYEEPYRKVGELGLSQVAVKEQAQDFDGALALLGEVRQRIDAGLAAVHPTVVAAKARGEAILSSTGVLTVRFIAAERLARVKGQRTDFRTGTLTLAPLDGGATPPQVDAASGRRVRAARYRCTARGAGGSATFEREVDVPSSGTSMALPALIPEGMVYVPAGGGAPAFLCDRTEVSNAAYQPFAASSGASSAGGSPGDAVAGVAHTDARRYATWAGKELPTLDQWTHAAFGAPRATSPRWPWGETDKQDGVHVHAGSSPGPVDAYPAGASRADCLNMAGNVHEWLSNGFFIGGSYGTNSFTVTFGLSQPLSDGSTEWTADVLRDRIPTPEVWDTLSIDDKIRREAYRMKPEEVDAFTQQIGFRCVISLE